MKKFIISLFILSSAFAAAEIDAAHKALLERLFEATKQQVTYEKAMTGGFDAALNSDMLPTDQKEKMAKGMERVKALMLEKMGWEVMKDEMYTVYAKHYSKEDLEKIVPALESEGAKAYFEKSVELLPEAMALGQKRAAAIQGDIQKIMMEEMMK